MTRVEQLRLERRLSIAELAEKTGIAFTTIYRLEQRQVQRPQVRTLAALADFFEVPLADLLPEVAAA